MSYSSSLARAKPASAEPRYNLREYVDISPKTRAYTSSDLKCALDKIRDQLYAENFRRLIESTRTRSLKVISTQKRCSITTASMPGLRNSIIDRDHELYPKWLLEKLQEHMLMHQRTFMIKPDLIPSYIRDNLENFGDNYYECSSLDGLSRNTSGFVPTCPDGCGITPPSLYPRWQIRRGIGNFFRSILDRDGRKILIPPHLRIGTHDSSHETGLPEQLAINLAQNMLAFMSVSLCPEHGIPVQSLGFKPTTRSGLDSDLERFIDDMPYGARRRINLHGADRPHRLGEMRIYGEFMFHWYDPVLWIESDSIEYWMDNVRYPDFPLQSQRGWKLHDYRTNLEGYAVPSGPSSTRFVPILVTSRKVPDLGSPGRGGLWPDYLRAEYDLFLDLIPSSDAAIPIFDLDGPDPEATAAGCNGAPQGKKLGHFLFNHEVCSQVQPDNYGTHYLLSMFWDPFVGIMFPPMDQHAVESMIDSDAEWLDSQNTNASLGLTLASMGCLSRHQKPYKAGQVCRTARDKAFVGPNSEGIGHFVLEHQFFDQHGEGEEARFLEKDPSTFGSYIETWAALAKQIDNSISKDLFELKNAVAGDAFNLKRMIRFLNWPYTKEIDRLGNNLLGRDLKFRNAGLQDVLAAYNIHFAAEYDINDINEPWTTGVLIGRGLNHGGETQLRILACWVHAALPKVEHETVVETLLDNRLQLKTYRDFLSVLHHPHVPSPVKTVLDDKEVHYQVEDWRAEPPPELGFPTLQNSFNEYWAMDRDDSSNWIHSFALRFLWAVREQFGYDDESWTSPQEYSLDDDLRVEFPNGHYPCSNTGTFTIPALTTKEDLMAGEVNLGLMEERGFPRELTEERCHHLHMTLDELVMWKTNTSKFYGLGDAEILS